MDGKFYVDRNSSLRTITWKDDDDDDDDDDYFKVTFIKVFRLVSTDVTIDLTLKFASEARMALISSSSRDGLSLSHLKSEILNCFCILIWIA